MGDVNRRNLQFLLNTPKLNLHSLAKLEIECSERLVHQEHARRIGHGPRHGDALRLAAAELGGISVLDAGQMNQIQQLANAIPDLLLAGATLLEAEADIVRDRHVREQGIVLEDHADFPLLRGDVRHVVVAEVDRALGGLDEPGNETQRRRFSASGGTQKGQKLTFLNLKIHFLERDDAPVVLDHPFEVDA